MQMIHNRHYMNQSRKQKRGYLTIAEKTNATKRRSTWETIGFFTLFVCFMTAIAALGTALSITQMQLEAYKQAHQDPCEVEEGV